MTPTENVHAPTVLAPYPGPDSDPEMLDVFVYLRPETNGVQVESSILSVIKKSPHYRSALNLVYLANIPGDYIVRNRIVERHYGLRLHFAVHGGAAFTPDMQSQFERHYQVPFREQEVIGGFDALRRYQWTPEELFSLWVEEEAVVRIAGQVVKRYKDVFIVNYDIPALLHKNDTETDIAVMVFRTRTGYRHFFRLALQMKDVLVDRGLMRAEMPISRAVHISRSPFEQLIDARDYLLLAPDRPATIWDSSFAQYLLGQGIDHAVIQGAVDHPVCTVSQDEEHLLELAEGADYPGALELLRRVRSQLVFSRGT